MNKNMQTSKLMIPRIIEKSNRNFRSLFNLIQQDDQNEYQTTIMINGNYQPSLQRLQYQLGPDDDSYPVSINDLHNNDKKILSLLNEEICSTYSFKAIQRKLDIHQQSLARALKRLGYLELIEKSSAGYKLIKKNMPLSKDLFEKSQIEEEEDPELFEAKKAKKKFNQLIQIRIPIKNSIELIVNRLIGKWFGDLRWFGLIKKETALTLQWIAINKYNNDNLFQININIVSEYIVIECNAVSDKEKIEAMLYSNRIVSEIMKTLQSNLQEEESEIPKEYAVTYTNKINYKSNK
jgi:DNA-binding transcriptional ArsR family regulator